MLMVSGSNCGVCLLPVRSRMLQHSALEAINALAERYGALQKRVHLRHLSSEYRLQDRTADVMS